MRPGRSGSSCTYKRALAGTLTVSFATAPGETVPWARSPAAMDHVRMVRMRLVTGTVSRTTPGVVLQSPRHAGAGAELRHPPVPELGDHRGRRPRHRSPSDRR